MTNRIVQKHLAGEEDLLFGRGTASQARNGGNYDITKLSVAKIVADVAELADLDHTKFPFVGVVETVGAVATLSFYEHIAGVGYSLAIMANTNKKSRASLSLLTQDTTSIVTANVPTKVLGTTQAVAGAVNFSHTSGRLVFTGEQVESFLVSASLQIASSNVAALAFYFAVDGVIVAETIHKVPAVGSAVPRAAMLTATLELEPNQFVEVYVANLDDTSDVTCVSYNMAVMA